MLHDVTCLQSWENICGTGTPQHRHLKGREAEPDSSHGTAGLPEAAAWLILIIYYCFPSLLLPRSDPCCTVSPRGVKEADFVSLVPDGGWSDPCTDASSALTLCLSSGRSLHPCFIWSHGAFTPHLPLEWRILGVSSPRALVQSRHSESTFTGQV